MYIKVGRTYTLNNNYFIEHSDKYLCINKGNDQWQKGGRPYFIAFQDKHDPKIYWAVPLSSNIKKYQKIIEKKIAKRGSCNTIYKGKFGNRETIWLIQNMCPIDVHSIKTLCSTPQGKPLMPNRNDARRVSAMAKQAQNNHLIKKPFLNVDIQKIYDALVQEHELLKKHDGQETSSAKSLTTKELFADVKRRAKEQNENKESGAQTHTSGRDDR